MSIDIIIPKKIYVLREPLKQDIKNKHEEYNLYYKNFITPLYPWYDIKIDCSYGRNFGHCWRLKEYPDVDSFPLTIMVYDEFGKKLAEKSITVELVDRCEGEEYTMLFFGDSMTHRSAYVEHIVKKLYNIKTIGTRSFNGNVFVEGRGGWSYKHYYERYWAKMDGPVNPLPVSPFLFPKGIDGADYFGDTDYYDTIASEDRSTYKFDGFRAEILADGQYYLKDGKLHLDGKEVADEVEWEISFKKYLERFSLKTPDAVSILLGANDLQMTSYEDTEEAVKEFIANTKKFIASVKEVSDDIDIIVNMPITGADQYAWGLCCGCNGSEKQYNHSMREIGKAIIEEFDGVDGIYISPMLATIDTVSSFESVTTQTNLYNDTPYKVHCNWVHPQERGYFQMGDAMTGIIEMLRQKR